MTIARRTEVRADYSRFSYNNSFLETVSKPRVTGSGIINTFYAI